MNLFQTALLVFFFHRHFGSSLLFTGVWACLKVILGAFIAYIFSRSMGPNGSGQFQGLLGTILSCSLPVLRSFLAGWNIVTLKGTAV